MRSAIRNLYGLMVGAAVIWVLITGYALDEYSGTRMGFKWHDFVAMLATLVFPLVLWGISSIAAAQTALTDATLQAHVKLIARFNKMCALWFMGGVVGLLIILGLLVMFGVALAVVGVGISGWWKLRSNVPAYGRES